MKNLVKLLAVLALVLVTFGVSIPAVLAAPPGNDTFTGATPVSIGFSETLDTTEATTDADDVQLNNPCEFPATDASVWYEFTGSDQGVLIKVSESDYSVGLLVGVGSQGNLQAVACQIGDMFLFVESGQTYYVLAFDPQYDGGGNGGDLIISFNEPPPPPTLEVTVNPSGTVNARTGTASISGTYSCTNGDFINVYNDARQNVGRVITVVGFSYIFDDGTCDGVPRSWSAEVVPYTGKFAGGTMLVRSSAFSCNQFTCGDAFFEQQVKLKGGPKK